MLDLKRFVPNGRVSTGLLAWRAGRLVWAISQRKYWQNDGRQTVIPLVGIGGGQETGETLTDTVRREAMEEAQSRIAIRGARGTLWVNADTGVVEQRDLAAALDGEAAPLLVWQMHLSLRNDDGTPRELDYINPVYEADLLDEPRPGAETPGLLHVAPATYLELADEPRTLSELLQTGATYIGADLPLDCLLVTQGSALFLARYWQRLQR